MIKIALAQMNLVVGDISGNTDRIIDAYRAGAADGAQIVAVPELAITGYPPEDLVLKRSFIAANHEALQKVAGETKEAIVMVGFVQAGNDRLYNAAAICQNGGVLAVYRKHRLPNYGVFDEDRYFEPGRGHFLLETEDGVVGLCICEDAWSPKGPITSQGDAGAQLIVNINASPFHKNKLREREEMLCERARRAGASIAYVNMVGGQDELVFDGGSLVIDPAGEVIARSPQFEEDLALVDVPLGRTNTSDHPSVIRIPAALTPSEPMGAATINEPLTGIAEVYEALKLSLSDYARKNSFTKAVIGLSGGIDSALTAAIAADALGPEAVLGVTMPSGFSSTGSIEDSLELARNLGIAIHKITIGELYSTFLAELEETFGDHEMGVAEENLQARIRGTILMTISNRYGHLVIATGNKSENAVGYATLYGDMVGGFSLLKDVLKTEVYDLARHRNTLGPAIPESTITKSPSAELRPDQKDSDSLPPYEVLDPILAAYIEQDAGLAEIEKLGFERDTILQVMRLVDRSEYKRRQGAPGPKVTTKAFGRDRRLPITSRWREA